MPVEFPTFPADAHVGATGPLTAGGKSVRRPPGWLGFRAAVDGLACLTVAVLMLRTFEVEGYMISTGSMAPTLYGYHKRVVCPTCGGLFARGVAFDGSSAMADEEDEGELFGGGRHAVCPNCGQGAIDVADVPRNHGDQLLVLKHAYEFRPPRRWEVIVFRNPNHPTQAFVKRVAGLPGERVQVKDGDIYADGEICRKSLETQRGMRISVFEADRAPADDPAWQPRWEGGAGWKVRGKGFVFAPKDRGAAAPRPEGEEVVWLAYHHRLRSGGSHETAVEVRGLPAGFRVSDSPFIEAVRFDPDLSDPTRGTLTAVGVVSEGWERRLRGLSSDGRYQDAVTKLVDRSREAPITDEYAYNRAVGLTPNPIRDLMVSFRLRLDGGGVFAAEMTDGLERFRLVADTRAETLTLVRATTGEELRNAELPAALLSAEGATVEMSVMDRQVLVALDGIEPFAAWAYDEPVEPGGAASASVRLGAGGLAADVGSLTLYRDVYYTRGKGKNGIDEPFALGEEYFVLGDNSPVSLDSRSWPDGAVPAKLLLGKPFVVHLPSRPGTLRLGKRELTVRIPDFARMRYIR